MASSWTVSRKVGVWVFASVVLSIVIGAVAYYSNGALLDSVAWRVHSETVLDTIERLRGDLLTAESGERGYLITGDVSYLQPYTAALPAIDRDLEAIQSLTGDNAAQQRRVDEVRPHIQNR